MRGTRVLVPGYEGYKGISAGVCGVLVPGYAGYEGISAGGVLRVRKEIRERVCQRCVKGVSRVCQGYVKGGKP